MSIVYGSCMDDKNDAADRSPDCVGCHVVGYEEKGGFSFEGHGSARFEDVGCESCHGRGGPHLSPEYTKAGYEPMCVTCHDKKHSLGFDFATFHPKISHAAKGAAASSAGGADVS